MADQGTEGLLSPWLHSVQSKTSTLHFQGEVLNFGCGSEALAEHIEPV